MENTPADGVSKPSPEWVPTAPNDASELDELAAQMEWERWRARPKVPRRFIVALAASIIVAIASLAMLIVLGHAGWTGLTR